MFDPKSTKIGPRARPLSLMFIDRGLSVRWCFRGGYGVDERPKIDIWGRSGVDLGSILVDQHRPKIDQKSSRNRPKSVEEGTLMDLGSTLVDLNGSKKPFRAILGRHGSILGQLGSLRSCFLDPAGRSWPPSGRPRGAPEVISDAIFGPKGQF